VSLDAIRRILVADDTDYGTGIADACRHADWIAYLCTNGSAAVDIARHDPLDAALISVRLADNRGDAILYRMAALQPHLRHRTILLTTSDAEARIAKVAGCIWMSKSQDPSLVVEMIAKYLPALA
jgi:ActR/RegA family two-component response regulator